MQSISTKYRAICGHCGHQGLCIRIFDGYGHPVTKWEGFDAIPAKEFKIREVKHPAGDVNAECQKCHARDVLLGEPVI
jgi:hypothetical protein